MIKRLLASVSCRLFGRRNYYRLARFLWIDARRDSLNKMSSNGEFAVQTAMIHLSNTRSEPVIFDIGANIGEYSAELLRKAGTQGLAEQFRLYSFEPNQKCVAAIKERVAGLTNSACSLVVQKIVTDQPGQASFYITGATAGSSSLRIDEKTQQGKRIEAECVTFDGFCREHAIEEVLFAKVDTEGNDMRVLKGANGMLETGRLHYLQFEYNHRWILFRNFLKDVFDLVEPLGYKVAKVTSRGLEVYPRWHFELEVFWEGNYLIGKDFEALGLPVLKSAIFD